MLHWALAVCTGNFRARVSNISQKNMRNCYKVNFSMFKSPEEMRSKISLDPEGYALVMQLKYKGKTEFVRFGTGKPAVQQIGGALKRLINKDNPELAYVYGELERDIYSRGRRDYGEHTMSERKSGCPHQYRIPYRYHQSYEPAIFQEA